MATSTTAAAAAAAAAAVFFFIFFLWCIAILVFFRDYFSGRAFTPRSLHQHHHFSLSLSLTLTRSRASAVDDDALTRALILLDFLRQNCVKDYLSHSLLHTHKQVHTHTSFM